MDAVRRIDLFLAERPFSLLLSRQETEDAFLSSLISSYDCRLETLPAGLADPPSVCGLPPLVWTGERLIRRTPSGLYRACLERRRRIVNTVTEELGAALPRILLVEVSQATFTWALGAGGGNNGGGGGMLFASPGLGLTLILDLRDEAHRRVGHTVAGRLREEVGRMEGGFCPDYDWYWWRNPPALYPRLLPLGPAPPPPSPRQPPPPSSSSSMRGAPSPTRVPRDRMCASR